MGKFSFEILVCAQEAKLAAYETSGYLYTLLDTKPEYRTRTSPWHNLKELLSLLLPEPPWSGPPLSHCFGITWGVVRDLLSGNIGIACVHLEGGKKWQMGLKNSTSDIAHSVAVSTGTGKS